MNEEELKEAQKVIDTPVTEQNADALLKSAYPDATVIGGSVEVINGVVTITGAHIELNTKEADEPDLA